MASTVESGKPNENSQIPAVKCPDLGSYAPHAGNSVAPLVDGHDAFGDIVQSILKAKSSVFVVIGFLNPASVLPGAPGDGTLFTLLDSCAARGVDVRMLCWGSGKWFHGTFPASEESHKILRDRECKFTVRWDASDRKYHCHHEKSWLIDVGTASEVVYCGGMGTDPLTVLATAEHLNPGPSKHDINVKLVGPVAADLHHSFVQRWNDACNRTKPFHSWPSGAADDLPFPKLRHPEVAGGDTVQLLRSVQAGRYCDSTPPVGGAPFPIKDGEASILAAYQAAFSAAKSYIYCENQHLAHPGLIQLLADACKRGVEVVYVAPRSPMNAVRVCAKQAAAYAAAPEGSPPAYSGVFLESFPLLASLPNFTLLGLAVNKGIGGESKAEDGDEAVDFVYVHAKLAIVDDAWLTIGSANLVDISFERDHTEVNVAIWGADTAKNLRVQLVKEHCGTDTSDVDGKTALQHLKAKATANTVNVSRAKPTSEDGVWSCAEGSKLACHAFVMDVTTYGL